MIVSWVCSTFVEFDHLDEFSVDDEAPYNAMTPAYSNWNILKGSK